jgi:hypothetical protein
MNSIEMPKYKSHKELWALKIKSITNNEDKTATIIPYEEGYPAFIVEEDYLLKHNPQVNGYYVVYKDGYKSFSPADAFEEGNILIKQTTFMDRLINEENELSEKINALEKALNSDGFQNKIGDYQFQLLSIQHNTMKIYNSILKMRIKDLKYDPF